MGQLPLALRLDRNATFESLTGAANAAAVAHVRALASGQQRGTVWLSGPAHTGKTHLLTAACRLAAESGLRPMYLRLAGDGDPEALHGLESIDLLALDAIDQVAGMPAFEAALFPILNARIEAGSLLLAARPGPRDCGFVLPDLASRAAAAATYRLAELDDEELGLALCRHAAQRGLGLDAAAVNFLLLRLNRDLAELTAWLDRIDRFALARQRPVTVPLLRQLLDADGGDAG
jgi:DnaA family protein